MEHGACNLVYVDQRATERTLRRNSTASVEAQPSSIIPSSIIPDYFKSDGGKQQDELQSSLDSLLSIFSTVHITSTGSACLTKLSEIESASNDNLPTLVLIDIPYDEEAQSKRWSREAQTPSPTFSRGLLRATTGETILDTADIYGIRLLAHIASEIQFKKLSKLMIPIAVVSGFERDWAPANVPSPSVHGSQLMSDSVRLTRFIDAGAVDVMTSPLTKANVQGLAMHAYRTYREISKGDATFMAAKRNRKMSWVGVEDEQPYSYLREAMVSNLMAGICTPEDATQDNTMSTTSNPSEIDPKRIDVVTKAVGSWTFSAHDLNDDELLYAALVMLEHALSMPQLEKWKIPSSQLISFLEACQNAYNSFVHYHNFRHAVDVMQAVFFFLLQLNVLPHFKYGPKTTQQSPAASLLQPFDALTLLVSAIGHDVGHPGVNNAFLVSLNAPLAQLYNDRSVLESFHCAAYSQILRRYWPSVFKDTSMRKLMINIILATDMGLHFKYMSDLKTLQTKIDVDQANASTWQAKDQDETRDLICGLLIKCADISNVARVFDSARKWADILTEEFANQGTMETELGIPTCLFGGPPAPGDIVKMAESQQGFINVFAAPLFQAVTNVLPSMSFSIDEMNKNKDIWEQKKAAVYSSQLSESDSVRKDSPNESSSATPISQSTLSAGVGAPLGPQNKSLSDPEIFTGRITDGHHSSTATALPLMQQMQQLAAESSPSVITGTDLPILMKANKTQTKGPKLFQKSPSTTSAPTQRAASAHHPRKKSSPRDDSPQINGTNPNFAASETDIRFLANGTIHKNNDHQTVHLSHHTEANSEHTAANGESEGNTDGRKNKRLAQSFKRLWKKRWHSKSTQDLREAEDDRAFDHSPGLASPSATSTSRETEKNGCGMS